MSPPSPLVFLLENESFYLHQGFCGKIHFSEIMIDICQKAILIKTYVYQVILGPVYDNEKENWRILTNEEIYANIKKPTITETIRLHRLHWFGHVQKWKKTGFPKEYCI